MKLFGILLIAVAFDLFAGCGEPNNEMSHDLIIGEGQMPSIAKDNGDYFHLTYGTGDSIMYSFSFDHGNTFSSPVLIAVLPKLFSFSMRGPQIAAVDDGVIVIACNNSGNIFSFTKDQSGKWSAPARVNDADTVAKEGLMALSGDGKNAFAVWLDLRDKHNKIYGARSTDGGKSWSGNKMIYASPDTTVCECCKPSVVVKGKNVFVMFRNWLNGIRDLYLVQSSDGGNSFGKAQKLGIGSWPLNGCPMDGGGLAINENNNPQTVWRRRDKIFTGEPGKPEQEIGEGRSCTMETINGKNVFAWTENGEVVVLKQNGKKNFLGKGQLPVIRAINNEHVLCVWENEKRIHATVVEL